MPNISRRRRNIKTAALAGLVVSIGLVLGVAGHDSLAEIDTPSEHKGLTVSALGMVDQNSLDAQIGLSGYVLQLREITIEPGGQIAQHDHATRPGLVKVVSGVWTEGRPEGETDYAASEPVGLIEDHETVHWFWNRGSEPATAIVCDIVPAP